MGGGAWIPKKLSDAPPTTHPSCRPPPPSRRLSELVSLHPATSRPGCTPLVMRVHNDCRSPPPPPPRAFGKRLFWLNRNRATNLEAGEKSTPPGCKTKTRHAPHRAQKFAPGLRQFWGEPFPSVLQLVGIHTHPPPQANGNPSPF